MKHHRKHLVPFVVYGGLAIFLSWWLVLAYARGCRAYSCITLPGFSGWKQDEVYEHTGKIWRGMLSSERRLMRLEVVFRVSPAEAAEFTNIRLMAIEGLYDTVQSPYPGAVSATIRCDERYKLHPTVIIAKDGMPVTYASGFLNARMQYGACVDNQLAYAGSIGFFYCAKRQFWVQMEVMTDMNHASTSDESLEFFRSVSCT